MMLQWRYSDVAVMFEWRCFVLHCVAAVSQCFWSHFAVVLCLCYNDVAVMLQWCYECVEAVLQQCLSGVAMVLQ
jgi:hypothetical protein